MNKNSTEKIKDADKQITTKLNSLQFSQTKIDGNNSVSQIKQKNPLSLAFFGDAFFSYSVRNFLFVNFDYKPNVLNKLASKIECAPKQAEFAKQLLPTFNDEEKDIFMRARNAHPSNKAKHASFEEYHLATAFEAVYGFWALNLPKYKHRLMEVYQMIAEAIK